MTSTVLDLLLMPALYLAFGRRGRRGELEDEGPGAEAVEAGHVRG